MTVSGQVTLAVPPDPPEPPEPVAELEAVAPAPPAPAAVAVAVALALVVALVVVVIVAATVVVPEPVPPEPLGPVTVPSMPVPSVVAVAPLFDASVAVVVVVLALADPWVLVVVTLDGVPAVVPRVPVSDPAFLAASPPDELQPLTASAARAASTLVGWGIRRAFTGEIVCGSVMRWV